MEWRRAIRAVFSRIYLQTRLRVGEPRDGSPAMCTKKSVSEHTGVYLSEHETHSELLGQFRNPGNDVHVMRIELRVEDV